MNKIFTGISTLVLTVALVAGTAYAAFSQTDTLKGITLGAATAGLTVKDATGIPIVSGGGQADASHFATAALIPGVENPLPFKLENTGDFDLDLSAQATVTSGSAELQNAIKIAVVPGTGSPAATDWHTLTQWANHSQDIAGPLVANSGNQDYTVYYMLSSNAAQTLQGQTVTFDLALTGTQASTLTPTPTPIPTPTP